jgi:hypothetical protein
MKHPWLLSLLLLGACVQSPAGWRSVTWNGEAAWESSAEGWRAVVSAPRARLIHFGPVGSDLNLLLAPPERDNPNRLGGHRLWLGPQTEWPAFWPPPAGWEYREAEQATLDGGVLRLAMRETGPDWPRLVRTYRWQGSSLVCGAEMSGGTRAVQFIHILQVPTDTLVRAEVHPADAFPTGYVRLLSGAGPFTARFTPPAHASLAGDQLTLRHTGDVGKYGFRPQVLTGTRSGYALVVTRGTQTGAVVDEPDAGFLSQVYLSEAREPFVEIEQLSPRFAAGQPASFEMILTGRALK